MSPNRAWRRRVQGPERALPIRPVSRLAQDLEPGQPGDAPGERSGVVTVAIDAGEAAIRAVVADAIAEHSEASGRGLDALFAMQLAEVVTSALALAGYEIKRRR
jgi:hypothetical protein